METEEMELYWRKYKFFPYEKKFALREIQSLLNPKEIKEDIHKIVVRNIKKSQLFENLVYFSHASFDGIQKDTLQFRYENTLKIDEKQRSKRQNTRYSVHGLHEYKGKFNPQVVKSLFNIFGISKGSRIMDPFCGSGTTLVEACHTGLDAFGTDINPLAVFIANTKISSLNIPWTEIQKHKITLLNQFETLKNSFVFTEDPRTEYLRNWFPEQTLIEMESLRTSATMLEKSIGNVFLVIISNILRDYSLQEPSDLRIRRRISAFPEKTFLEQVKESIDLFVHSLKVFQSEFELIDANSHAHNIPIQELLGNDLSVENSVDFAITSPPYATALPYVDTQRLSLVWLELIEARQIKQLESELTGSREFMAKSVKELWAENLKTNKYDLPSEIFEFCEKLNGMLTESDGFRKKVLPSLLYRYFYDMEKAFKSVYFQLKKDKYFALIVGHNHTMIGGERTEINTPEFLTYLGKKVGFHIHEITPLEAYQRYGLNSSNAVQSESLIVFKK